MSVSLLIGALTVLAWTSAGTAPAFAAAGVRCEVYTDAQGIPHARGTDEAGAFRCQGYLHGRDRAWQMDYFRRITQGRLSEVLGSDTVKMDFQMRLMGFSDRAGKLYTALPEPEKTLLVAYTEGVNRGMTEAVEQGAYEFREFGYRPDPWEPRDSIAMVLLQSFDQTKRSFEEKLREQKRFERYGEEAASFFQEDGAPWDTAILKPGEYKKGSAQAALDPVVPATVARSRDFAELDRWLAPLSGSGTGSNNWAVSGARSRTGHALFANDPHLNLKTPSFWYWSHVEGGPIRAIGASVPGIPVIVSGTNGRLAWGLTNAYTDVSDLFHRDETTLKQAIAERPWIWVRFWKFKLPMFFKTFRRTEQGWPILPLPAPDGKALVLRWSGFDVEARDVAALLNLMRNENVEQMDATLAAARVPSWNFVFADDRGRIGYRTIGRVPARERSLAYGVSSSAREWRYLEKDEMPHVLNPARGYVVTANNRQWPADAANWSGRVFRHGFRASRIEQLILAEEKHHLGSMSRIQCDTQAVDARFLLPLLFRALREGRENRDEASSPREEFALKALRDWDYLTGVSCTPCAIYRLWVNRLLEDYGLEERSLFRLLQSSQRPEDFREGVRTAFVAALDLLDVRDGQALKTWGSVHQTRFPHFAGPGRFRAALIPVPGDEHSVNVSASKWFSSEKILHSDAGASQRLIVELSNPPRVLMSLPGTEKDVFPVETSDPRGPWMRWSRCEYKAAEYPLDWARARTTAVHF